MTLMAPEGVKAQGNTLITVLADLDPDAVSVAALKGSSAVTISCHLYGDMATNAETESLTKPRRSCEDTETEVDGATKYTIDDIQYTYAPQGDDTDDANAVKVALEPDSTMWFVERLGKSAKRSAWTVGDKVILHHVRVGKQRRTRTGDDAAAEFSITQSVKYVDDEPVEATLVA